MTTTPGRLSRAFDIVGLLLVIAGIALYAWTFTEMRALRDAPHDPAAPLFSYRARWDALSRQSWMGIALIGGGVLLAIAGAMHHRWTRKRDG